MRPTATAWVSFVVFCSALAGIGFASGGSARADQPGTMVEFGTDLGPIFHDYAFHVAYENAVNAQGTQIALKQHGWTFQMISLSQAIWKAHPNKGDPCT